MTRNSPEDELANVKRRRTTWYTIMCMFCTFHVFSSFLLCCNPSAFVICAMKNYLLTYYSLQNTIDSSILADELHRVADIDSQRRLRSASTSTLIPPTRHSIIGDHAFLVAAWRVWNSLPSSVTSSTSLSAFRRRLKTELFSRCFGLDSV